MIKSLLPATVTGAERIEVVGSWELVMPVLFDKMLLWIVNEGVATIEVAEFTTAAMACLVLNATVELSNSAVAIA